MQIRNNERVNFKNVYLQLLQKQRCTLTYLQGEDGTHVQCYYN